MAVLSPIYHNVLGFALGVLSTAGRFKIADAFALAISAEILFYIFAFVALCGALQTHFHGKGRNGKRHVAAVGLSPSRSDYKSVEHKKSSSGATWIFCMEPNCFGVTRGVQPLVCNGDDRGQRPKQGGAVGAAACRMRVPSKARSRRREPQPAASRASKVAETLPR